MSQETMEWLNGGHILVGMGERPWWADDEMLASLTGESPLYAGPIPVEDVRRRLFYWSAESYLAASLRPVPEGYNGPTVTMDGGTYRLVIDQDRQVIGPTDSDDTFGVFKSGYDAYNHQFGDVLVNATANILDDDLGIESAGLLRNRAVAWVSVSVPDAITTDEGVEYRPRLICASSFDGTIATTWKRAFGLPVCDNTLEMALHEGGGEVFKIRHTKHSGVRIANAREALGIVYKMADAFQEQIAQLCEQTVTEGQWAAVLDALVIMPTEPGRGMTRAANRREKLDQMYRYDPRCKTWTGTAFGVLQTFNTFDQHESSVRAKTNRVERNMLRVIGGTVAEHDAKVLDVLSAVLV